MKNENGYVIRKSKEYDKTFAIDKKMLFEFLRASQEDAMLLLQKQYKDNTEKTLINFINNSIDKRSLLDVLKHGVEIDNIKLELMYNKPASTINKTLVDNYEKNIFSVMEEVYISDKERIDLVIFLNGFAIMSFELKCNMSGQSYNNAITQYRTQRDPQNRLFLFKHGCLVNFAMDLEEVYMTTKLSNEDTFFLPFNMGNGEGINASAGNPIFKDKYSVSYIWEDILKKDTILELIKKFIFIQSTEKVDKITNEKSKKETLIFPRYHQLDVIRKLLENTYVNKTSKNYLIQHSAGSGKTNSIAWLSHRLASLHDENNKAIFNNILIVTDRIIVDRQLQSAVMCLEHKSGLIRVMDNKCNSSDLAKAIEGNTKIIVTTIQKFPYIVKSVSEMKKKKFAVIIDEAHSSTSGKNMSSINKSLGSDDNESGNIEDIIIDEIKKNGKQENVSFFAFTATPKATTLSQFGNINAEGKLKPFHIYSMKQAIEEGFILDVLQNFTEYKTYCEINKIILDDPTCKINDAKKQIKKFVELHETNIAQRVEIIIEHFRTKVMSELGGSAKAIVITESREGAVKYRQAFDNYIIEKGYTGIKALVAFSGKTTLTDDKTEYTEVGMNGISEDKLKDEFDKDEYQVLIVANKYQTGFDQPKLCAMYIMKKLKGVSAVQTLSRLNRICPPYEKKTFILDFTNKYEDMVNAFETYYKGTILLANTVRPSLIYKLEAQIDEYGIIKQDDIDETNNLICKQEVTLDEKKILIYLFQESKKLLSTYSIKEQKKFVSLLKKFIRFYEFIIQVSLFEDVELHKKYNYISHLISYININNAGAGYNLDGKIKASNFVQEKGEEYKSTKMESDPIVNLPNVYKFGITYENEMKLSKIIDEINSRLGKNFDNDGVIKSILQIKDILIKSDKLKRSAKNNTIDNFEYSYFDDIVDELSNGFSQNEKFYTLLLDNEEVRKQILGVFIQEIYDNLRKLG